jgi:hypothetical protein
MSQIPRFTRARQLTSTVLPGRRQDDYADQVTGRLRKLAAARSTGTLPFSGRSDGVVYFRDGKVAYAESNRTPGPAPHAYPESAEDLPPLSRITAILAITEPTVDAALELLSAQSRYARFRPSKIPDTGLTSDISLEALLAEVARRQRVLKQLSTVLTADTALARNPHIHPESIRVSALQWSLLIRVRHGTTPRDLAWDLSRSVFGTTAEAYRLLTRRLLSVAGDPAGPVGPEGTAGHGVRGTRGAWPGPSLTAMSFVRAASVEKGETVPIFSAEVAPGGVG